MGAGLLSASQPNKPSENPHFVAAFVMLVWLPFQAEAARAGYGRA